MRPPWLRVPIPAKLLVVSCLLLLVPWLGIQYVRELERLLRQVQEQGLVSTARAVATALHDRPNVLLSGEVYSLPTTPGRDLVVPNLERPITLDGHAADWDQPNVEARFDGVSTDGGGLFSLRHRIGRFGTGVYVLFDVQDDRIVFRDPSREVTAADQIRIALVTADDEFLRFAIDAETEGAVAAWLVGTDGSRVPDSRISGVLRLAAGGYVAELRLPRTLIGPRLSFAVVDVDDPETRTLVGRLGSDATAREELGTVLVPSPEISEIIRGLGRGRSRIWVVDVNRRVLAWAGSLHEPAPPRATSDPTVWDRLTETWVRPLTRRFLREPSEDFQDLEPGTYKLEGSEIEAALAGREATRWRVTPDSRAVVLSASHPVWVEEKVRGAVLVEETTNDVLAVRNRAFEKLFAAILAVSLVGAAALLVFASRLSWRIRRLRNQVERAIDRQGRVSGAVSGSAAGDEIGDLARSFSEILERQRQHTSYLEDVGKRLSHELRTPVGVVRSSLDNLRLQPCPESARVYIERADEGLRRLATILSRMSEATRLEQVLAATEHEPFDGAAVVAGCVEGYRLANPGREILLQPATGKVPLWGGADLFAQMLDKLIENALGFARPATPVSVALAADGRWARLSVENEGPTLPQGTEGRLFQSMVSVRASAGDRAVPHLGLGLYVVRLIAEFHGGHASARDRTAGDGVVVTVSLPLHEVEARAGAAAPASRERPAGAGT